jgi:peptide/nickel transport system substrate-binding protein
MVALLAPVLAACGGSGNKSVSETPKTGGTLTRVRSGTDANSFHPYLTTDAYSSQAQGLLYISLLDYHPQTLDYVGSAAESYKISDDKLSFTFKMRKGLQWSDGRPITSADVKWTWDQFRNPANGYPRQSLYKQVKSLEAPDADTVVAKIDEIFAPILDRVGGFAILPKHVWEKLNWKDNPEMTKASVVAGPFKLVEWKKDQQMVFEANLKFFKGRPRLDRIIFKVVPNSTVAYTQLKNGEVDIYDDISADDWLDAEKNPDLKTLRYFSAQSSWGYFGFNFTNPLFQDVRVRRALAYAVNRPQMIDRIVHGLGEPINSLIIPESWAFNKDVKGYEYDPARAKKLLDDAGWRAGPDGTRVKDGKRFKVKLMGSSGSKLVEQRITYLQSYLKAVGVEAEPDYIEFQSLLDRIRKPPFAWDMMTLGWSGGLDPDSDILRSNSIPQVNSVQYRNSRVDDLYLEGVKSYDHKVRKKSYDEIQKLVTEDEPYIFLWNSPQLTAMSKKVGGLIPSKLSVRHNIEQWWCTTCNK